MWFSKRRKTPFDSLQILAEYQAAQDEMLQQSLAAARDLAITTDHGLFRELPGLENDPVVARGTIELRELLARYLALEDYTNKLFARDTNINVRYILTRDTDPDRLLLLRAFSGGCDDARIVGGATVARGDEELFAAWL